GVAAAGLAALPLTVGFFKDELFFAAALERGPVFAGLAVLGAALTFAYAWRFWGGIFLGRSAAEADRQSGVLVWPVVALGGLAVLGGILVGPYLGLALAAGSDSLGSAASVSAAYHLDARPENLMALATYGLGALIIFSRPLWSGAALALSRLGERIGPERLYEAGLRSLNGLSDRVHRAEARDLRSRVAAILLPGGVLIGAGVLATPTGGIYRIGEVRPQDVPLLLALLPVVVAALTTTITKRHVTLALVLSSVGFVLALVYAFFGAPDVALVAVLVETVLTLLFLGTLRLVPHEVLHRQAGLPTEKRWRKAFYAAVAGASTFAVVWGTLSRPAPERSVAEEHLRLTPDAHAGDAVTAILADFRGLDTLGEISVVALVLLAVVTLLRDGRLR
nr:DUF4040 domain-containing protein [Actinomycetota bacterium]